MKKLVTDAVDEIIAMPITFEKTDKSPLELLRDSGYFDWPDAITVELLADSLKKNPRSIDYWLAWSDNKRAASGWYFQRAGKDSFVIGYYPTAENLQKLICADPFLACANFIKREIEAMRNLSG
jgi:hypothetical protein